jgi:two-component system, chemotaxis family, sensor kinase CheA
MSKIPISHLPAVKAMLDCLVDPAYVVDRDFTLVWVNQAYQQAFSYKIRRQLPCHEVAQMDICRTEQCLLERCKSKRGATNLIETKVAGAKEANTTCLAAGFPLIDPATGEITAAVGILRDNTAEVRLQKRYGEMLDAERNRKVLLEHMVAERTAELTEANATLNQRNAEVERSRREVADILENISQAILTIDERLEVGQEYSRFSEQLFGKASLAGLSFPELLAPGDGDTRRRKDLIEWLKLVFHSPTLDWKLAKRMAETEYRLVRSDGRTAELRVDFEPIREDQRVKRIMVLIQDLTEKRQLERAIDAKDREMNETIEHLAEVARLDPEMHEALFEEALEIVGRSGDALKKIRDTPDPTALIDGMFRDMHTLKGNAMSFGLVRVAAKAHWVEDAFSELRQSAASLTEALIADTEEKVHELGDLFQRIQAMANRVLAQTVPRDNGSVRALNREIKLQIDNTALDQLIEWAVTQLGDSKEGRELVTRLRSLTLIPLSRLYGRFPKMMDDLAEELGKRIYPVALSGGELSMDARAFNRVANAVVHLLRNAVDHGIESPEVRQRSDKPPRGTISVRAYHDGDKVRVDVADDGAGMDPEKLVEVARERGLLRPDEHPSGEAALALIFRAGFSTAQTVTDLSGRGVGMDAVKELIEELGGGIEIETRKGTGTRFKVWIPLAAALGRNPDQPPGLQSSSG